MFTILKIIISANIRQMPNCAANSCLIKNIGQNIQRVNFTVQASLSNMVSKKETKSICFADYDVIGFDCDHTLAQYNLHHLFKDTYEMMADYLVNERGYDKELFKFNPSFCSRGIILDSNTGNFIKLAHDGRIMRAFHGTKPLKKSDYDSQTCPQHEEISRTMKNIGTRYKIFENFFDLASSLLCAQIIDHLDEKHNGKPESYDVWPEVLPAVKFVYIPHEFKGRDSLLYSQWIKNPGRYLEKGGTKLKQWLKDLKMNGRTMFILSSAYEDFAEATLKFVLGDDWSKFFDFSVFLAEKPGFFCEKNPFYHLTPSCEQVLTSDLKHCKSVHGGNLAHLKEHLSFLTGKENPKVLYFGDSQKSDIIPSKVYSGWDNVLVLEEMACETCFHGNRVDNLKIETCRFEEPSVMPWGSIFVDTLETKSGDPQGDAKVQTLVCSVARKYADIAIPNLQFLFDYPLNHKFSTFDPTDESSLSGFHPFIPQPIRQ